MAEVQIPSLLQDLTGGADQVSAPGATVGELIDALDQRFPGLRDRLCDGRRLRPAVAVWVDGEPSREGLLQRLTDQSDVQFLPNISGGSQDACHQSVTPASALRVGAQDRGTNDPIAPARQTYPRHAPPVVHAGPPLP